MPSLRVPGASTWMTEPTGSSAGSAAAIPDRTFTPEAVVVPLQYAVALNERCAPAAGTGPTSAAGPTRRPKRESRMRVSCRNTKAVTTSSVASTLRQRWREISTIFRRTPGSRSSAQASSALPSRARSHRTKVREAFGQLLVAAVTLQHDRSVARHHADAGDHESAREPDHGTEPALATRRHGEQQLVIVSARHTLDEGIAPTCFEPGARRGIDRQRLRVDGHAHPTRPRDLAQTIRQAVAQVHARGRRLVAAEQYAQTDPRVGTEIAICRCDDIPVFGGTVAWLHGGRLAHGEARASRANRSADEHEVARSRAGAREDAPGPGRA